MFRLHSRFHRLPILIALLTLGVPRAPDSNLAHLASTDRIPAVHAADPSSPIRSFYSPSFRQQLDGIGRSTVKLRNMELRPDDGSQYWTPWYRFSTSFTTRFLRGRFADDFLVVGEHEGGRTVLERWMITPVKGSWTIERPTQPADLGVPVQALVPPALVAAGGEWIAPEARSGRPVERRVLVDDNLDGAPLRALEFDPDGRYAVYVGTKPAGLYRRLLSGSPTQSEELLHSEASIPHVGEIRLLYFKQHAAYGRVLVCEYGAFDFARFTLLVDGDNDGIFDAPLEVGLKAYNATFEGDPALVPDDFEEYDL